jgi:hypothetical protein
MQSTRALTRADAVRLLIARGSFPIAGADSALDEKVKQLGAQIADEKKAAQVAWQEFDEHRKRLAEAGADVTNPDSDVFKAADEKHKAYTSKADAIVKLEDARERLWAMTAEDGKSARGSEHREVREALKESVADGKNVRDLLSKSAINSEAYKALKSQGILNNGSRLPIGNVVLHNSRDEKSWDDQIAEVKTLLYEGSPQAANSATGPGALFRPDRVGYFPLLQRPLLLTDLITVGQTQSNAVEFVQQTTVTNNAAAVAEASSAAVIDGSTVTNAIGGLKPESGMAWAVVQAAVKTIANWEPATRQALSDAGQLATIIDQQLRYNVAYVLDSEIVSGDGTGQHFTGIMSTSGILTRAKGTDTAVDALHKAMTSIRLNFIEPNGVGLHPTDWETIRLSKDANGNYLYGPPAMAGTQQVWGLPVATGAQFTQGTGIVADWKQAIVWIREGIQVLASDSHNDFFVRNLVAVLAEMRAAFGIPRPKAFETVTGL